MDRHLGNTRGLGGTVLPTKQMQIKDNAASQNLPLEGSCKSDETNKDLRR